MSDAPIRFSANGEHGLPFDKALMPRLRIFVDGDMPRHVIAYDIEAGWVEVVGHNELGNCIYDRLTGEWVIRRVHGKVRVVVNPGLCPGCDNSACRKHGSQCGRRS